MKSSGTEKKDIFTLDQKKKGQEEDGGENDELAKRSGHNNHLYAEEKGGGKKKEVERLVPFFQQKLVIRLSNRTILRGKDRRMTTPYRNIEKESMHQRGRRKSGCQESRQAPVWGK